MLSPSHLQAIREREQAATKGPWLSSCRRSPEPIQWDISALRIGNMGEVLFRLVEGTETKNAHDLFFISQARTDIPALLAHLDEQAEEIGKLRKIFSKFEWEGRSKTCFVCTAHQSQGHFSECPLSALSPSQE